MAINSKRLRNLADTTSQTAVTISSTTATKISDALTDGLESQERSYFRVDNSSNVGDIIIKLQAASIDNLSIGIVVIKMGGFWEMPQGSIYVGEISVIASNGSPIVLVTEY